MEFLGNWDVVGLSGTGSYDYELAEQFVDTDWTFSLTSAVPQRGGPVYRLGVLVLTSIGHCGFALGVGRAVIGGGGPDLPVQVAHGRSHDDQRAADVPV